MPLKPPDLDSSAYSVKEMVNLQILPALARIEVHLTTLNGRTTDLEVAVAPLSDLRRNLNRLAFVVLTAIFTIVATIVATAVLH